MCGWCGRLTAQPCEYANGATVLRLCPDCAASESARKLPRTLPVRGLAAITEDENAIPGPPAWIRWTAIVVLLTFLLGFAGLIFSN